MYYYGKLKSEIHSIHKTEGIENKPNRAEIWAPFQ